MTRIEQIRQREQQATKGPWEFIYGDGIKRQAFTRKGDGELKRIARKDEPVVAIGDDGACGDPECCGSPNYHVECSTADGEFIAHAREDIPHLLRLWDTRDAALRTLVEQWRAACDKNKRRAFELAAQQAPLAAALISDMYATAACADALDAILKETTP